MSIATSQAAKFKAMLKSGKMIVAPGAIDCITGRLIEQAGFAAVYMTGAGTSATLGQHRTGPSGPSIDGRLGFTA